MFRKRHNSHGTFEPFIQAHHGRFSDLLVIGDDRIPLFSSVIYRVAVPHLLKFCPDPRLIFLRHFFRDLLREMELVALPRNIWKHRADDILNAFMSIQC